MCGNWITVWNKPKMLRYNSIYVYKYYQWYKSLIWIKF